MNILCIAPYHVSGTLHLWRVELARRGHRFRYVTLFRSPFGYPEDISLDLPLQPDNGVFLALRRIFYKTVKGFEPDEAPIQSRPPLQPEPHPLARAFFALRDRLIEPRVESAIRRLNLDAADIIWLDQGAEFYRDGRTVRRWADAGKPMMAFYHGSDMRNRGIMPQVDAHVGLRLTSEVDLLYLDDRLEYLFLPLDVRAVSPVERTRLARDPTLDHPLRIGHAARVRANKGTDRIIDAVTELRLAGHPVEMVMIENVPHGEATRLIASCDVFVDQVADAGGWGYGMAGIEALARGVPVVTRMGPEMRAFVPDHPFVQASPDTLDQELARLVTDSHFRCEKGREGRAWVERRHDIRAVADQLLRYWGRDGWIG